MNLIIKDGGVKSRKLWFAVFAIAVIVGAGLYGPALWAGSVAFYDAMVGGVVAIAAAYLTGNVAQKWVGAKAQPAIIAAQQAATAPKPLADKPEEEPAQPPAPRFSED